jgi:hypothetical protein
MVANIVEFTIPALNAANYQRFNEALAALFEALGPWTAAVIMDSSDDEDWHYCLMKGLARYLSIVMPEIEQNLPVDDSQRLVEDLERAKGRLKSGDVRADVAADIKARKAKEQLQLRPRLRITAIQRLRRVKDKVRVSKSHKGSSTLRDGILHAATMGTQTHR